MAKLEQIDDSNKKLKQNNTSYKKKNKTDQGLAKLFLYVDYIFLLIFFAFLSFILFKFVVGL